MLTSLALIFLVGLAAASICQRIRLPRIIGMLATGILLGPYVLDFLDGSILSISSDLIPLSSVSKGVTVTLALPDLASFTSSFIQADLSSASITS